MPNISQSTWRILTASFIPGVGKATLWRIASQPEFFRVTDEDLGELFPELKSLKKGQAHYDIAHKKADRQLSRAADLGCKIVGFWDAEYPATFRRAPLAPAIFWYNGNIDALNHPSVGIIGTRQPTDAGVISAKRITAALASEGLNIVSGLALGIDTIAHQSALDSGGLTTAILPGGLDHIAPKSNQELASRIVDSGGGLLSEFPLGLPPLPANFVTRDSTQAALSVSVILVQSDKVGGSLHASRAIVKLKRKLIVVAPTPIDTKGFEPKIQANEVFSRGYFDTAISSMSFPEDVEKYTTILRSRNDYPDILESITRYWLSLRPRGPQQERPHG